MEEDSREVFGREERQHTLSGNTLCERGEEADELRGWPAI